jgi:hypothetical protein
MRKLGERNYAIIVQGIKGTGSYDPKENFYWFEEQLYIHESDTIWEFLAWCHAGGTKPHPVHGLPIPIRGFGIGNYEERFKEFLEVRDKAIQEFEDNLNSDTQFNYKETEFHDWFVDYYTN